MTVKIRQFSSQLSAGTVSILAAFAITSAAFAAGAESLTVGEVVHFQGGNRHSLGTVSALLPNHQVSVAILQAESEGIPTQVFSENQLGRRVDTLNGFSRGSQVQGTGRFSSSAGTVGTVYSDGYAEVWDANHIILGNYSAGYHRSTNRHAKVVIPLRNLKIIAQPSMDPRL